MNFLKNKIYVLTAPRQLILEEEELNTFLKDDEILAKSVYSCISPGTELAAYQGLPPLRPGKQYPRVQGYCNVAQVLEAGEKSGFAPGSFILSFSSHRQYFKIGSTEVIATLKENDKLKLCSTVYLFHLAYAALLEADIRPGLRIGIVGIGTLGYCAATLSKTFCLKTSVFSNQSYLDKEFTTKNIMTFRKQATDIEEQKNTYDIIINTSNSWEDWFLSMSLLRKKGIMINLGFPGRGLNPSQQNPLDSQFFYDKQLTVKSAGHIYRGQSEPFDIRFNLERNIQFLLDLINDGTVDAGKILSKEVQWSELKPLYEFLLDRSERKFTGLLNWIEQ